ncbi:MAG: hemerythrin domain-containing protein, partial [Methyloligellaceae bacterium]
PKEDLVFAKLKQRDAQAAEAVGKLEAEHEDIAAEFRKFSEAVQSILMEAEMPRGAFDHAVRGFIDHERRHIEKEEELFFPAARRALTPEDWVELDAALAGNKDPLFSEEVEEEFKALRQQIVRWEREDEAERAGSGAHSGE